MPFPRARSSSPTRATTPSNSRTIRRSLSIPSVWVCIHPSIRPANATAGVYNDGGNNDDFSNLLGQNGLIIAATRVGQTKTLAWYANMCGVTTSWCVAAPSGDQYNGAGIWTTSPGDTFGYFGGTSAAVPMVSGSLVVLVQAYSNYNAQDLAHLLFATAENIGGQAADNRIYGYGLIRFDRANAGPLRLPPGR